MSEVSKLVVNGSFKKLGPLSYQIFSQVPSLRLLAAFLQTSNYLTVQMRLVENEEIPSMQRGGVFKDDKKLLALFEEKWPLVKKEMDNHRIKPRAWCGAYRLTNDYNQADLSAIINPERHELNYGDNTTGYRLDEKTVLKYFKEDFPKAFPGEKYSSYSSKELLPELYYEHTIAHKDAKTIHILKNDELNIKVIRPTFEKSYHTFQLRLITEVKLARMRYLIGMGVTTENIEKALFWLPKDVPQTKRQPCAKIPVAVLL